MRAKLLKCTKEYDIRGIFGKELNEELFYYLGSILNASSIVIGKDARDSSSVLLNAFLLGLMDSGAKIYEIGGISTSPLVYFAQKYLNTDFAAIITASHNPMQFNGIKLIQKGKPLYGMSLKKLLDNKIEKGRGVHKLINIRSEYLKALSSNIKLEGKIKVAWDCFNSGVEEILSKIKLSNQDIIPRQKERFLNIPPDPLITNNLELLKSRVLLHNSDIGFAFDGDGDRLVVMKSDGTILTSDQVIYLLTKLINIKGRVILDVKASTKLIATLKSEGYEVILTSSGHSIIKDQIIEKSAILAGEASGHYIINDGAYYPFDDALYIALRIIHYLQANNFMCKFETFPIRNEYRLERKIHYPPEVYSLMGLRRELDDNSGWYLIRASNTDNNVLVKYEAENKKMESLIKRKIDELLNL